MSSPEPTAGAPSPAEPLLETQYYELLFWKEKWPYRDWAIPELQKLRHADAAWLLSNLGFRQRDELSFHGFEGDVLEVGCGPIGFFELMRGVEVTAIDSLMGAYAAEIRYSTLGKRGSATYAAKRLDEVAETYKFVVCSNVLDYSDDWMEFLEMLVRRLRPDGELLLSTDTRTRPSIGHSQVFTAAQLRRALDWLGLRAIQTFRVEGPSNDLCEHRVLARIGF